MIKFNYLIHKETGKIISYDEWLEHYKAEIDIEWMENKKYYRYYHPTKMLFSDEFEIIYDSEFTTKELNNINYCIKLAVSENVGDEYLDKQQELINKVDTILEKIEFNKYNYGIEGVNRNEIEKVSKEKDYWKQCYEIALGHLNETESNMKRLQEGIKASMAELKKKYGDLL